MHFAMEHAPRVEEDTSSSECPENPVIRIYKDVDSRYQDGTLRYEGNPVKTVEYSENAAPRPVAL